MTEIVFKYIIVGEQSVGKSAILEQYVNQQFDPDYSVTIGIEFYTKNISIDGQNVGLQLWDTAGHHTFRDIAKQFYRNAAGLIAVYSVDDNKSLENLKYWISEARENALEDLTIFLLGNKIDLSQQYVMGLDNLFSRNLSQDQKQSFMLDNNLEYCYEVSAKDGTNIDEAFQDLTRIILQKQNNNKGLESSNLVERRSQSIQLKKDDLLIQEKDNKNNKCC